MSTTTSPPEVLPYRTPPPPPPRGWRVEPGDLLARLGPLIGLGFVFLLFTALSPNKFPTRDNVELMLRQTAVVGTAALGMSLIIIAGGIDLSVGSNIALSTVTVALMLKAGAPPAAAAACGVLVSGVCGLGIGTMIVGRLARVDGFVAAILVFLWMLHRAGLAWWLAALIAAPAVPAAWLLDIRIIKRIRLAPFIVTLGMWGALRGVAKGIADQKSVYPPAGWRQTWLYGLMRSAAPMPRWMMALLILWLVLVVAHALLALLGYRRAMPARNAAAAAAPFAIAVAGWLALGRWPVFPLGVWQMLAFAVVMAAVLRYTRFGRHVFAIGSNEQTARLCGVPVERCKLLIYALGGAFAGLAGVLEFSYITTGDPTTRPGAELDVIAAVVIGGASLAGGQGSVFGSLIGALIMTMVANGCTKLGLENWVQEVVTGGIIVHAVALDQLRHRRAE